MSDQVQFAPLEPSNGAGPGDSADLERLYDVTVELAVDPVKQAADAAAVMIWLSRVGAPVAR